MTAFSSLPDRIVDHFLANIVTGQLNPGEKLPPYRELAKSLGVDATSLRNALRVLNRMHLITSVQGSGNLVNDYQEVAGLDLLDALCRIPELELGRRLSELALDTFLDIMQYFLPTTFAHTSSNAEHLFHLMLNKQLLNFREGASSLTLAQEDMRGVELLVRQQGNLYLAMMLNSTYLLRLHFTEVMYRSIDVEAYIASLRKIFNQSVAQECSIEETRKQLKRHLNKYTRGVRGYIATLAEMPCIKKPITLI